MAADIQIPGGGYIHVSDRHKYIVNQTTGVGTFYEARTTFPVITRTLGDWLSNSVEFSSLTFEVSNVDGRYNQWLPGGTSYDGFVGKRVVVSLGLAELGDTYKPIFDGKITDVGGVARSLKSATFTARDLFDIANIQFPPAVYQLSAFPFIDDGLVNTIVPVIYGDYTYATDPAPASIPATVVNGADLRVNKTRNLTVAISIGSPAVLSSGVPNHLVDGVPLQLITTGTLPSPFTTGVTYYAVSTGNFSFSLASSLGGPAIGTSGTQTGTQQIQGADPTTAPATNVQCLISDNALAFLDIGQIYLKRGDLYFLVPQALITNVSTDLRAFQVIQDPTNLWIVDASGATSAFAYADGDLFYVRVKGKDLGAYSDNLVWQARDILLTYSSLTSSQIDANWASFRDKAAPAESAIANFKGRVWLQEQEAVLQYVKSMVEQVRLELFISKDETVKLSSLHFDDFPPSPSYMVAQWDVVRDTLQPALDVRNNFNRAQANFNFLPDINKEARLTRYYKNDASITQLGGKPISKILVYPNLYREEDCLPQLKETLKLASSTFEVISVTLTWRAILLDVGDFVRFNISVGGIIYKNVPCLIRSIGYDPTGLKLPMTLWSLALVPFPGYTPGYAGTVGGYNATITEE